MYSPLSCIYCSNIIGVVHCFETNSPFFSFLFVCGSFFIKYFLNTLYSELRHSVSKSGFSYFDLSAIPNLCYFLWNDELLETRLQMIEILVLEIFNKAKVTKADFMVILPTFADFMVKAGNPPCKAPPPVNHLCLTIPTINVSTRHNIIEKNHRKM